MQQNIRLVCAIFALVFLVLAAFPKLTEPRPVALQWLAGACLVLGYLVL
jgi:hypothetical protein